MKSTKLDLDANSTNWPAPVLYWLVVWEVVTADTMKQEQILLTFKLQARSIHIPVFCASKIFHGSNSQHDFPVSESPEAGSVFSPPIASQPFRCLDKPSNTRVWFHSYSWRYTDILSMAISFSTLLKPRKGLSPSCSPLLYSLTCHVGNTAYFSNTSDRIDAQGIKWSCLYIHPVEAFQDVPSGQKTKLSRLQSCIQICFCLFNDWLEINSSQQVHCFATSLRSMIAIEPSGMCQLHHCLREEFEIDYLGESSEAQSVGWLVILSLALQYNTTYAAVWLNGPYTIIFDKHRILFEQSVKQWTTNWLWKECIVDRGGRIVESA